jgi:hypothetical protein
VSARPDHDSDAREITDSESSDLVSDGGHPADDLVAGNDGVDRLLPLVARHVDVGVAHSAVENLELHIFW